MDKARKEEISRYLKGVKDGDRESLELLYYAISPSIRFIALRHIKNRTEVSDLIQDFWAAVPRLAQSYRFTQNAFSYLCKCMHNMALNRAKHLELESYKYEEYIDNVNYTNEPSEYDNLELKELNDFIDKVINELSDKERIVIQLTYFEDKTVRKIAKEIHLSKAMVTKIKKSAIEKLKKEILAFDVDKRA